MESEGTALSTSRLTIKQKFPRSTVDCYCLIRESHAVINPAPARDPNEQYGKSLGCLIECMTQVAIKVITRI